MITVSAHKYCVPTKFLGFTVSRRWFAQLLVTIDGDLLSLVTGSNTITRLDYYVEDERTKHSVLTDIVRVTGPQPTERIIRMEMTWDYPVQFRIKIKALDDRLFTVIDISSNAVMVPGRRS